MKITIGNHTIRKQKQFSMGDGDKVFLMLVFLGAINLFNRSTVFMFCAAIFYVLLNQKLSFSKNIVPVLFFSVSLMVFWETAHEGIMPMIRTFLFPLCFFLGYNFLRKQADNKQREHAFFVVVFVLALGTWAHLGLNAITSVGSQSRNTVDIWTQEVRAATGQAGLGIIMLGLTIAVLFSETRRWAKLAALVALGVIMWYNLVLAGRTLIVVAAITAAMALIYRFCANSKGKLKLLLTVLFVVALILILYANDSFGLRTAVEESNLYQRFTGKYAQDVSETGRTERKLAYLPYLFDYPFGGGKIHVLAGGYAHDLYLDTYDEAGVFALLAVVVFVVQSVVVAFRMLRSQRFSFNTKMLVLCLFLCFHMEFIVEPILAGLDWLLAFYCMIYGAMTSMVDSQQEVVNENIVAC